MDDGLRFDAGAKAELHARLLTAASSLWDVIDAREAAGSREVSALEADGWVSQSQQATAKHFGRMMQLEVGHVTGNAPRVPPPPPPPPLLPPPPHPPTPFPHGHPPLPFQCWCALPCSLARCRPLSPYHARAGGLGGSSLRLGVCVWDALQVDRFSTLYHTLLDYFYVAEGGRVGDVPPLDAGAEPGGGDPSTSAAPAGGKAGPGGAAKGAPAGKQPLATKASQKKGMVEAEVEAPPAVDPLEEALGPATRSLTLGRALALSALRNVAKIKASQDSERRARWNAALVAIATEREAREAAAEAAANAAKGGKGKAPAKAGGAKPGAGKGGKGAVDAPAVPDPNPSFVFLNESVLDAVVFEAQQVVDRLEYLARRCRTDSVDVAQQGSLLVSDLRAVVAEAAALEGGAVEAFAAHVGRAIEAHHRVDHSLRLEVRVRRRPGDGFGAG